MTTWADPRPNDFTEAGIRARFKSLQDWLANPSFNEGILLGEGATPTYDAATGVAAPPVPTEVTSENVALFAQDAIQSDNYDGTTVAAGDATVGWRLERDTGSLEAGDARIRGEITASEFHGADPANLCANPGFDTNTTGWTAGADTTISRTTNATANGTDPGYRTGPACLKMLRSSGSGSVGAYYTLTVAPGDVVQASAYMSSEVAVHGNAFTVEMRFYDGVTLKRTETRSERILSGAWQLVEKFFAIPDEGVDWAGIDSVQVEFLANNGSTTSWVGLDDVFIGKAPLIEVPYLVTNEDAAHTRAFVLPDNIGFQRNAGYATGMRDVNGDLQVWGPLAASGRIPRLDLELTSDGLEARAEIISDKFYINNRLAPLGAIGFGQDANNRNGITTSFLTLPGTAIVHEFVAGRRYRISAKVNIDVTAGNGLIVSAMNGAVEYSRLIQDNATTASGRNWMGWSVFTATGSLTLALGVRSPFGTINVNGGTVPSQFVLEDLGQA